MGDGTDDKDVDYVPITDAARNEVVDGWTGHVPDHTMREKHRQAFMAMAFPPKKDDEEEKENPQAKSASIPTCRSKEDYEYIKYVVGNWQKGTNIRSMAIVVSP